MAKGCGNNSVEFWYYGKGNITEVGIPITYNAGTASQGGSTTIVGVDATWTTAMVGHSFDFIQADGTIIPAGKITLVAGDGASLVVTKAQTVAVGSPISYVIKNRGEYPLGSDIELSLSHTGVGKGAAFKVWLRPQAGSIPLISELDRIDVLNGGLNYKTHRYVAATSSGETNKVYRGGLPLPILGGAATAGTAIKHGKVEITDAMITTGYIWIQAKTFDNVNSVISTEIEYTADYMTWATVTLANRAPNISSLFSLDSGSGQYSDFFKEGHEILLRDHTTHIILFRGHIQELQDTYELGMGQVLQIDAADSLREWDDFPAELLESTATSKNVDLASSKIYEIIENQVRPFKSIADGERRIAFAEGPLYRLATGATHPISVSQGVVATEGLVAAQRGHGHQVGRRFAFENSWYPREATTTHFATTGSSGEPIINERDNVIQSPFFKGKRKVLDLVANIASQDKHGNYIDGGATYHIAIPNMGAEWYFHLSPNILTPVPETLAGISTDGTNDLWVTNNTRTGATDALTSSNGLNYAGITAADALNGRGFYPSDIGKIFTMGGSSREIRGVGQNLAGVPNTRLELSAAGGSITWTDGAAFSIAESLSSIPQFNYFEVGSRPSFGFDPASGEIIDARSHSVTMIRPIQPVVDQGIDLARDTEAQQNAQMVTQPALTGTVNGVVTTGITGTYNLKNILTWEVRIKTATTFEFKYAAIGRDMEGVDFAGTTTISGSAQAQTLAYGVQITFATASGHTIGDIYRFTSYPQFDNTRALQIMQGDVVWSNHAYEKYSTALVYYDSAAGSGDQYGESRFIRMDLIYGWNVQNRSWVWHTSADSESGVSNIYTVRVHQGDAADPHDAEPLDGEESECINFSSSSNARVLYKDLKSGGNTYGIDREAFKAPGRWLDFDPTNNEPADWHTKEDVGTGAAITSQYKYRDFYWKDKLLTEGDIDFFSGKDIKASRGSRVSEYLDVYRGRYSVSPLDRDSDNNTIPDEFQIEWRRWESGKRVAAIQWVNGKGMAPFDPGETADNHVHKSSGGSDSVFPFAAGQKEEEMIRILVSFDTGTKGTWPTTNTYDDKGTPQSDVIWHDFPFVRLVGETSGTKIDFDANIALRPDSHSWEGRPSDTWGALKPLRKMFNKDHHPDEIRKDVEMALHKRVADQRMGKFMTSKAPYYWLEAQVDGWQQQGSSGYGNSNLDPGAATTNPNADKVIRFKLQKLAWLDETSYYNPLQYGLMIGNIVRFYNYQTDNVAFKNQNFHDSNEFCYGVITDIQSITTPPSGGSEYPQNEDTYAMCGWIEVQLTHTARKTVTTTNGIKFIRVVADVSTSNSGYNEDLLNPGVPTGAMGTSDAFDYKGPTRVKVYNMLYPGYAIRAEDSANGVSGRQIIEGMKYESRSTGISTEYTTSGHKYDQGLIKWGSVPHHLAKDITELGSKAVREAAKVTASGIGNTPLDVVNESSNVFWFEDIGGDDTIFAPHDNTKYDR